LTKEKNLAAANAELTKQKNLANSTNLTKQKKTWPPPTPNWQNKKNLANSTNLTKHKKKLGRRQQLDKTKKLGRRQQLDKTKKTWPPTTTRQNKKLGQLDNNNTKNMSNSTNLTKHKKNLAADNNLTKQKKLGRRQQLDETKRTRPTPTTRFTV